MDPLSALTHKILGLKVGYWLILVAAVVFLIVKIADNAVEDVLDQAEKSGAAQGTAKSQEQILNQVEKANDAEKEIDRGGDAERYARCLQDATPATRGNCERFRPVSD